LKRQTWQRPTNANRSREDLFPAEPQIEAFLTDLAVPGNVAPATQTRAMNALVWLYKRGLDQLQRKSCVGYAPKFGLC
jgi:Phage integrase, N-terminal SAM-like domain